MMAGTTMAAITADSATDFVYVQKQELAYAKIKSFINSLEEDLAKLLGGRLSMTTVDEYITVSPADLLNVIQVKEASGVELCIKNMILEVINRLNKKSGISSYIACITALYTIQKQLYLKQLGSESQLTEDVLQKLSNASRHVTHDDIRKTIGIYLKDNMVSSMVIQAYNMAGHSGQIFVDKEYAASSCVELTNGYTFPYGVLPEFATSTKTALWKDTSVKCLIIDGKIESVSEIHHVLQYFFEEKWAGIIICRGFGEEVIGTLIANYNRNTLNVVPVIVPYDLEGVNALVDIATVCNTDVISSLKGELISSIDISEISTVEKVTLSNKMIITNPGVEGDVKFHLNNLLNQKDETTIDDKKDLLDKRAKALSSVCAHIKIDSHQKYRGLCFSRIDHGIKLFREMAGYGAIKIDDDYHEIQDKAIINTFDIFLENGYTHLPAYSLILGYKVGKELADSILSSSVYLLLDN